jgi:hypothetical protein
MLCTCLLTLPEADPGVELPSLAAAELVEVFLLLSRGAGSARGSSLEAVLARCAVLGDMACAGVVGTLGVGGIGVDGAAMLRSRCPRPGL